MPRARIEQRDTIRHDASGVGAEQSRDRRDDRGLAAAGAPEQRREAVRLHREVDVEAKASQLLSDRDVQPGVVMMHIHPGQAAALGQALWRSFADEHPADAPRKHLREQRGPASASAIDRAASRAAAPSPPGVCVAV